MADNTPSEVVARISGLKLGGDLELIADLLSQGGFTVEILSEN